jgi:hypothetical protein
MPAPLPITLLVCDKATLDAQGKASLLGLFDVIWAAAFPSLHAELTVFAQVQFREPGATRVVLEAPDGTPLAVADACRAVAPGKAQAICTFADLTLPAAGDYVVRLIAAEGTVATTTFEVRSRQ